MSDEQARALLVKIIEHLSLEVDDPDRWPDLEAILATALREADARGLEEAAGLVEEHDCAGSSGYEVQRDTVTIIRTQAAARRAGPLESPA